MVLNLFTERITISSVDKVGGPKISVQGSEDLRRPAKKDSNPHD